ncbi:hypothetical protein PCANB_000073 [Pneumocystis canis]|nr:hypothetical protein PCK1_000208 [Pneumocystis canis]KAG5439791.1 hypothetical protein PCANB_000073 [Pneumocystis canis]
MDRRKAEIEAKRNKLAEFRRHIEERREQFVLSKVSDETLSPIKQTDSFNTRKDIDDLVARLIADTKNTAKETIIENKEPIILEKSFNKIKSDNEDISQPLSMAPLLHLFNITPLQIPSKPITYNKEIQTSDELDTLKDSEAEFQAELEIRLKQALDEALQKERKHNEKKEIHEPKQEIRILCEEQRNSVLNSLQFQNFIEKSSKMIERALDQEYHPAIDYSADFPLNKDKNSEKEIKEIIQFQSEKWTFNRVITDLDWNNHFKELSLASYSRNKGFFSDSDGLVMIWNLYLHDRPEYIFNAQSNILSAKFSPFHPNLIVGGSYNGQILLWDTRATSHPVLMSPLTGIGHSHPVYGVRVIGTSNANNIISMSTDGIICAWTIDMLTQPQEILELTAPPSCKYDDVCSSCIEIPESDPTTFFVGTEEGPIYFVSRYDRAGSKAGVDPKLIYKGHVAPVTSISLHSSKGPLDLGDLVLSSSLDWSIKLWKVRSSSSLNVDHLNDAYNSNFYAPIMEFRCNEIVYDVGWSPIRPGIWASVNGSGLLEIWNLDTNTETPITQIFPSTTFPNNRALNKLSWERHEGKRIAVGGLDGIVSIIDVGDFGGAEVKQEEWLNIKKLVNKNNNDRNEINK